MTVFPTDRPRFEPVHARGTARPATAAGNPPGPGAASAGAASPGAASPDAPGVAPAGAASGGEPAPRRPPLRLEPEIWDGLETAAAAERIRLVDLRAMVGAARCGVPEARALRLFAIAYFHARARAQAAGHSSRPGPSRALTAALETVARGGL